jgi:hypothetical protein
LAFHSGREADHSPPSSTEVKEWVSFTSIPPIRLYGVVLRGSTVSFKHTRSSVRIITRSTFVRNEMSKTYTTAPISLSFYPKRDIFREIFGIHCMICQYSDWATGWTTGVPFPAGAGFILSSPPHPDRLWDSLGLLSDGYQGFFPQG